MDHAFIKGLRHSLLFELFYPGDLASRGNLAQAFSGESLAMATRSGENVLET